MTDTQLYVLGFAFDNDAANRATQVLLIRKTKPEWQAGFLNGIGGKVEPSDPSQDTAMVREFREECGIETQVEEWTRFATIDVPGAMVACYKAALPRSRFVEAKTTTDEEVISVFVDEIPSDTMPNLKWLIPLALCPSHPGTTSQFVTSVHL